MDPNSIYADMVGYIRSHQGQALLAAGTEGLLNPAQTLVYLEQFKTEVTTNKTYEKICNDFQYVNLANKMEVVPILSKRDLISATTYNDYYKFTMAPVIGAVEDHQSFTGKKIHVTFAVDLRDEGIAASMLKNELGYHADISIALHEFSKRKFNKKILRSLDNFPPFSSTLTTTYWADNGNNEKQIFGTMAEPNTILGIHVRQNTIDDNCSYIRHIRGLVHDAGRIRRFTKHEEKFSGNGVIDESDMPSQEGEEINIETDFWPNTIVLKGQFVPNLDCSIVVLAMYVSSDAKKQKEYADKPVKAGETRPAGTPCKLNIEATGKWRNVSWLETSMMQTVYQCAHTRDLIIRTGLAGGVIVSYGQWLAEALFRTFLGMEYLKEMPANNKSQPMLPGKIKAALFSGRRTGGFLYNLLQVYLWSKFDTPFPPPPGKAPGRNMGTSSVDAWYYLNRMERTDDRLIAAPAGTHAHELSMVLSSVYHHLDTHPSGLVLTQVLGHYLYYKLTHQNSPAPMPMLSDTLGTESFLRAANLIAADLNGFPDISNVPEALLKPTEARIAYLTKDPISGDKMKVPFLKIIGSARQDSGELEDFAALLKKYGVEAGMMASEIDKIIDFLKAQGLGYLFSGVGGALGDTEKVWNTTGGREFMASMAVKAVRVFFNGKLEHPHSYPIKTGDGITTAKVATDTTLPIDHYRFVVNKAITTRDTQRYSHEVHAQVDMVKRSDDMDKEAQLYELSKMISKLNLADPVHQEINRFFHEIANQILSTAHPTLVTKYSTPTSYTSSIEGMAAQNRAPAMGVVAEQVMEMVAPPSPKRTREELPAVGAFGALGGRRIKSNIRKINKTLSKVRKNKRTKSIRKNRRSYRRY
jgi:hypothetical protein